MQQLGSRHAKYLKIALRHISSLDQTPVDLGAVVFGESFLDPPTPSHAVLVLTEHVETHCGWLGEGQEQDTECMSSLINRLRFSKNNRHYSMGAMLLTEPIKGVRMLTGFPEIPTITGQLWVLQRGFIFSSMRLGSIAIDFKKHVVALSHFNAQAQARDHDPAAVFSFELRGNVPRYGILEANLSLPAPSIVLSSGDADRRVLLRDVLPEWLTWFKSEEVECTALDALPAGYSDTQVLSNMSWGAEAMTINTETQPKVLSYLNAIQELDARLHKGKAPESSPAVQRPNASQACRVVVFLGEPGCDKYKLVHGAMQLVGLANTWKLVSYKHPRSPLNLDESELAATLLAVLPSVPAGMLSRAWLPLLQLPAEYRLRVTCAK